MLCILTSVKSFQQNLSERANTMRQLWFDPSRAVVWPVWFQTKICVNAASSTVEDILPPKFKIPNFNQHAFRFAFSVAAMAFAAFKYQLCWVLARCPIYVIQFFPSCLIYLYNINWSRKWAFRKAPIFLFIFVCCVAIHTPPCNYLLGIL